MTIFYSASAKGFFDARINSVIPGDAVEVTEQERADLLAIEAAGGTISADGAGAPIATPGAAPTLAAAQAAIAARIAGEATRRLGGTNGLRAELLELRRLVVSGAAPTQEQADRFASQDAIEAAATQVTTDMLAQPDPLAFDYKTDSRWSTL